ncbi:MAG: ATP citrate synthase [Candidatus Thermoplasmatota archaeon]|jgi:ATP-citrate lyase alpha-subunit|nr:ATP citrate synthase [Candidatus Thermoplasmatota archaeon]
MEPYILFSNTSRAIVFNMQTRAVQRMLDFDILCGREIPSVAAIVNPGNPGTHQAHWGKGELLIPIYSTIGEATQAHPDIDVMVNFASFRSAYPSTKEAILNDRIRVVAVIAEGVPERRARELAHLAKSKGKVIIGPATVGGIGAGTFKIGNTAGTLENIKEQRLYRRGSVGLVTKSGGLLNEMFNIVSHNTDGVFEGIAIGGDKFPGSSLLDHLLRYEANPKVKMLVALGELGGDEEYKVVEAMNKGLLTKPLVFWVMGTCSKVFPTEVQFGHAGAKAGSDKETADAKNAALKKAGAIIPSSFDALGDEIARTFLKLKDEGKIVPVKEPETLPNIPMDYADALKKGVIRKPTSFMTTISDDRGEEVNYAGYPISELIHNGKGIGDVISLLWFGRPFPKWAADFMEMVLMIVADHGPAVSGAHNAIIAARAGKDVISSLASGMLTIGPRFGGAIDDCAKFMNDARTRGLDPRGFVEEMKVKNILIPGIGHRVKSLENPDGRVTLLIEYARKNFPKTDTLDFAIGVQALTTQKKSNLILNVDGTIGVMMVDMLRSVGYYTDDEIKRIINDGYLNSFFVIGRSIGLIGHILDQKRNNQRLYRHPWEDILYMVDRKE